MSGGESDDALVHGALQTPCGPLGITLRGGRLVSLEWFPEWPVAGARSPALVRIADQIRAYFRDPGVRFRCRLDLSASLFCLRVWGALLTIPPGQTRTYGQLARQLDATPRAVAAACRANPCPVVIPCHRVVAQDGLGGYGGGRSPALLAVKRCLLRHEGWHG